MKKSVKIFGKQVGLGKIIYYAIFFILFSVFSFVEEPFIKTTYLKNDIKNFEDNYSWKIYLVLWIFFVIFAFYKIEKTKEAIGELGMLVLLYLVAGYLLFNNIITTNALFINQVKVLEKETVSYEIFNYSNDISLTEIKNNKERISEESFFDKINEKRKRNQLEPLNQVKHGDTVNVVFDKGLFGFKYLK